MATDLLCAQAGGGTLDFDLCLRVASPCSTLFLFIFCSVTLLCRDLWLLQGLTTWGHLWVEECPCSSLPALVLGCPSLHHPVREELPAPTCTNSP